MDSVPVVQLSSLSKQYRVRKASGLQAGPDFDTIWALKGIDLSVRHGEIVGILGRNGAGKTTLLNVLAGVLTQTSGSCFVKGKVRGLFNLGVGFQDELSGRENIFLNGAIIGASRREIEERLPAIIEFSELDKFIELPLGTYSQGMRLRLAFSIITSLEADILVVDEVLGVGDALFQSKCFERFMEFKRQAKTLIITGQNLEFMERLCDSILVLDHGRIVFQGSPAEAINRYSMLLNTERFFVGPEPGRIQVIENTKKWANDIGTWGQQTGTKQVRITAVEFRDRFGRKVARIPSGKALTVRVRFRADHIIPEPHFGIAFFRNDGVYCYGTNTLNDGYFIPQIREGAGSFELRYERVLFAPGEYRFSVAIWGKREDIAYDYHEGCYAVSITGGANRNRELTRVPFRKNGLLFRGAPLEFPGCAPDLPESVAGGDGLAIASLRMYDSAGQSRDDFFTGDSVAVVCSLNRRIRERGAVAWIGLYRDDGIYCQGMAVRAGGKDRFRIDLPSLLLLPGYYKVSAGVWDRAGGKCILYVPGLLTFAVRFDRRDHGTVYLKHTWKWELPH